MNAHVRPGQGVQQPLETHPLLMVPVAVAVGDRHSWLSGTHVAPVPFPSHGVREGQPRGGGGRARWQTPAVRSEKGFAGGSLTRSFKIFSCAFRGNVLEQCIRYLKIKKIEQLASLFKLIKLITLESDKGCI